MGCSESKIDDKQTMKQCKRSKAYMKKSISAHASFADAHLAYALALKMAGAALANYADGGYSSNRFEKLVIQGNVVEESKEEQNLSKVFKKVGDRFINTSESANKVSRILEANKLNHHSKFGDSRGLSARLMRVITLNKSSRRPKNLNDPKDNFVYTEKKTLTAILDNTLVREKKLYKQAKAGEDMKYAYQRNIASLNRIKKRGVSNDSLERAQANVNDLHTRYIADLQSIDSSITEINHLRDEQLYPKLVQLVQEMATMWKNMQKQHEHQITIIHALQNFKTLELPVETSDRNLINTRKLHHRVKFWSSKFKKLMKHQRNYIKSLENWLQCNLVIITNHNSKPEYPKTKSLLRSWLDELEKLPTEDTITAIDKFAKDIHTIARLQLNQKQMKKKCDETQKKLLKESQRFERLCNKDIAKKLPSFEIDHIEAIAKQKTTVLALKLRLAAKKETYEKMRVKVKHTMVVNLRTRLPEVLKDVSVFARACSLMYTKLNVKR